MSADARSARYRRLGRSWLLRGVAVLIAAAFVGLLVYGVLARSPHTTTSWCVPCREEAPGLERAWRIARGRGVLFLGLDEQDITDDARSFLRVFRIDYLNVREPTNGVGRRYGVTGFPETFFISARGRIVGHVIGVADAAKLAQGIAAARSGRVIGSEHGGARSDAR